MKRSAGKKNIFSLVHVFDPSALSVLDLSNIYFEIPFTSVGIKKEVFSVALLHFTLLHPSSPSQNSGEKSLALGIATTLALCDMAATVPAVLALLLSFIATPGLGTLGLLIGAAALFELRVSLKEYVSEMMHARNQSSRRDQRNGRDRDKRKRE